METDTKTANESHTVADWTETEYLNALSMAEAWMGAEPGSKEEDMLKMLVNDIIAYEEIHYPMEED